MTAIPSSFLRDLSETRRFAAGRPVNVKVVPGAQEGQPSRAIFLRSGARDNRQTLFAVDIPENASNAPVDASEILNPEILVGINADGELSVAEKAMLERMRVSARGFITYQINPTAEVAMLVFGGKIYLYYFGTKQVKQLGPPEGSAGPAIDPKFCPTGKFIFFCRNNDLWRVEIETNAEEQITFGGSETITHGLAEFVAQEEMHRFSGFWVSPDGSMVCFEQADHTEVERFHIPDPIAPEKEPISFYYPRPGKNNAVVRLGLVDLNSTKDSATGARKVTWLDYDNKAFPYVATVVWPRAGDDAGSPSASPVTVLVQNREQTLQKLLVVSDLSTGATRELLEVKEDKWINLDQSFPIFVNEDDRWKFFFGVEEEVGWNIGLYEMASDSDGPAKLAETWVDPSAGYTKLVGWDAESKKLYYRAGPNPTEAYVYCATRDDRNSIKAERVSKLASPAVEDGVLVGTDTTGKFLALVRTDLATMPQTFLYRCSGEKAPELVFEVPSVAETPGFKPNISIAQLPGPKDFWTAVIRPYSPLEAGKKRPVILQVYGGPHHLEVTHTCLPNLTLQWLAETTGAIVVKLDGRGTPGRGKTWERAIKHDFVRVPVEDQCAGVKAIAANLIKDECVDVEKEGILGVNGWSYGGYMAAAMALKSLEFGGLKVANCVAGAPVTEWWVGRHGTEPWLLSA